MDVELPEWAGRVVLAEAVRAAGLPWVPGAVWRWPTDRLSYGDRMLAIGLECQVLAEGRRLLPPGVSGAALGKEWRDMAWRCIVAGLSMLDAAGRARLAGDEPEEQVAEEPAVVPMPAPPVPVVIRRRDPSVPAAWPTESAPAIVKIRRRGKVPHAS